MHALDGENNQGPQPTGWAMPHIDQMPADQKPACVEARGHQPRLDGEAAEVIVMEGAASQAPFADCGDCQLQTRQAGEVRPECGGLPARTALRRGSHLGSRSCQGRTPKSGPHRRAGHSRRVANANGRRTFFEAAVH